MTTRGATQALIVATIGVWVAWTLRVTSNEEEEDSISEVITDSVHRRPVLAFLAGMVWGHWLWPPMRSHRDRFNRA